MATSEYISEKGRSSENAGFASPVRLRRRLGVSVLAPLPLVINDLLAVLVAVGAALLVRAALLRKGFALGQVFRTAGDVPLAVVYLACFMLALVLEASRHGLYGRVVRNANGLHEFRVTAQACLNAGLLLCGLLYMAHNRDISRALVLFLIVSTMVSLCARRAVCRVRRYRQYENGTRTRRAVILGTNHMGQALSRQIKSRSHLGYTFMGFIPAPHEAAAKAAQIDVLGSLKELRQVVLKHFVDEIIITEACTVEQVIELLNQARVLDVDVSALSGFYSDLAINAEIEYLGMFPLVSLHRGAQRVFSFAVKRVLDFVFSVLALIVAAPVMAAIAIAIRLEGEGPVFYVGQRIGKRGRMFPCFKFRTMISNADQLRPDVEALNERDGVLFKVKNDPRITPLGRFLRKYSLDEWPQFLNVLRGEMSLVGPRPPISSEVDQYELEHLRRLEVLPGITGLWQVQARGDASFERYIALDTAYVEHWSLWLDVKILFRTVDVVLRGTGV